MRGKDQNHHITRNKVLITASYHDSPAKLGTLYTFIVNKQLSFSNFAANNVSQLHFLSQYYAQNFIQCLLIII